MGVLLLMLVLMLVVHRHRWRALRLDISSVPGLYMTRGIVLAVERGIDRTSAWMLRAFVGGRAARLVLEIQVFE